MYEARRALEDGEPHQFWAYPTPNRTCSWDCPFLRICPMFDDGWVRTTPWRTRTCVQIPMTTTTVRMIDDRTFRSDQQLDGGDLRAVQVGQDDPWLTAPYPRLVLDVENGTKFALINRTYWNPLRADPPVADGSWDTCIVHCTSFEIMLRTYQWLQSGKHQFSSLIIDSISELQVKIVEQVAGRTTVQLQQWGDIGRATSGLMRDMRDLTMHPTKPLEAVILTAMERENNNTGQKSPYLSGQSAITLPYLMDITGYFAWGSFPEPGPDRHAVPASIICTSHSNPKYVAGERVGGHLGEVGAKAIRPVHQRDDPDHLPRCSPTTPAHPVAAPVEAALYSCSHKPVTFNSETFKEGKSE